MQLHYTAYSENPFAWDFADNETGMPTQPYDELGLYSTLLRFSYHVACVCGFTLSSTMLYLVLFRTSGPLKQYGRMLMLCSITDISYWAMDNFVQIKGKLVDGVYMAKFEGPAQYLRYDHQTIAMACFVCTMAWIHTVLPAQYYFRFYAVTRSQTLSGLHTFFVYCLSFGFAVLMGLCAYMGYAYSAYVRPGYNYGTLWYREVPLPKVLYADIRNMYQKVYFFYANVLVSGCYVMSLYYAYKTVQHLNKNSSMYSERTKSMQRQLSRALFFQSLLPVFTSIGPILCICVPSFFYMDTGKSAMLFMNITTWVPVFNPLLTISVIVPYRRAVLSCFGRSTVHVSKDSSKPEDLTMDMMV
ncbi:unnamed protein product [Bursaphelenchus okinawaensis]|uniref:G_PROTEIN_RECEP_F1_2 domain-containing protein n=1 Tax=Bursaphelenchus okinawaensis TaxID=465554 RepID=A0A811K4S7_9BILA|nr:unnamed protein product [Bursaphelenchus okinawaensis]CAG9091303.1 unnamed protein product [Bursaphelenchus okinawaensis]